MPNLISKYYLKLTIPLPVPTPLILRGPVPKMWCSFRLTFCAGCPLRSILPQTVLSAPGSDSLQAFSTVGILRNTADASGAIPTPPGRSPLCQSLRRCAEQQSWSFRGSSRSERVSRWTVPAEAGRQRYPDVSPIAWSTGFREMRSMHPRAEAGPVDDDIVSLYS